MQQTTRVPHGRNRLQTSAPFLIPSLCAMTLAACSAGGGDGSDGDFTISTVSVTPDQTWQINRPIQVRFTRPVNFNTVSLNTVQITQVNGAPALGDFFLSSPNTIVFQPRCPTAEDFSDAGLQPAGKRYVLHMPPGGSGGVSLQSTNGEPLGLGRTIYFNTPNSTLPNDLFLDPEPGPATPKIWDPASQTMAEQVGNSYVELGGDPNNRVYFEFDAGTVTGNLPAGFEMPLNFYSSPESQVAVVIEFNQPVNPSSVNINQNRIRLEFQDVDGDWETLSSTVTLAANCVESGSTQAGSRVRIEPLGILPQARPLRVVVASEFEDLVGQRNQIDLTSFALMETAIAVDPGTMVPGDAADELFEDFNSSATQDTTAVFNSPSADWGKNNSSQLQASFAFSGSGGPGGDFDWFLPANQVVVLDTSSTIITGGPGGLPITQQVVVGGVVNVRDLRIPEGTTLRVQGPNPLRILASGTVTINGNLFCRGNSNSGVVTLNTNFQPEQGASGNGGGGRGGTGSYNTTQATPMGGPGRGAFGVTGGGGQGGESSFATGSVNDRRPGGGGGGFLGRDQNVVGNQNCPDQFYIGLDSEDGFDGSPTATGAVTNSSTPRGGARGVGPWADGNDNNNYWGTRVRFGADADPLNDVLIPGELLAPTAGAGGGGGGDAYNSDTFPTDPYMPFSDDKGAGGGGGGGSITILALGDIIVGPNGTINADGGLGGGGENTGGINRIGGGSGGGSGGHIVLQTASQIDFSQVLGFGKIVARGGQGGAGRNDQGGAKAGANMTLPNFDGIHNEVSNCPQAPLFVDVVCAGGDGGVGLLQLHAPSVDDIIGPQGFIGGVRNICYPRPVGYNPANAVNDFEDVMVPIFGRFSASRSKWSELGGVHINPGSMVPDPVTFHFGGTDPVTGFVNATAQVVDELPSIIPAATLVAPPAAPSFNPGMLQLRLASAAFTDDLYVRNPGLLARYELQADDGITVTSFDIAGGTYDEVNDEVLVTILDPDGNAGLALVPGVDVEILPHYFRMVTNGVVDSLPSSSTVRIEFQAAPAGASGAPDLANAFPSSNTFATDIEDLNTAPGNPDFAFFRFQVTFDIQADMGDLGFDTPRPALEYLRVPIRF